MDKPRLPIGTQYPQSTPHSFADHEQGLWRAVITQALMDAANNSKKPEAKQAKKEALTWLQGDSDDFFYVCDQANLPASYVREKAAQALKRGCSWRLPAGQGWRTQAKLLANRPQTNFH